MYQFFVCLFVCFKHFCVRSLKGYLSALEALVCTSPQKQCIAAAITVVILNFVLIIPWPFCTVFSHIFFFFLNQAVCFLSPVFELYL